MERMVSLTLKLEANCAAEKSGTKKTPRTESPRQKDNVSSPKTKQKSSKSGTKSPPKEKTKSGGSCSHVYNCVVFNFYINDS